MLCFGCFAISTIRWLPQVNLLSLTAQISEKLCLSADGWFAVKPSPPACDPVQLKGSQELDVDPHENLAALMRCFGWLSNSETKQTLFPQHAGCFFSSFVQLIRAQRRRPCFYLTCAFLFFSDVHAFIFTTEILCIVMGSLSRWTPSFTAFPHTENLCLPSLLS